MVRIPFRRRRDPVAPPPLEDHRAYVGGLWHEVGKLQFDFLLARGLRPDHVLLDVACGSLRGGVYFIDYLEPGNYLGIDREQKLIQLGLDHELAPGVAEEKRPEFVVSDSFEFDRFSKRPDVSLAQSLFSHLTAGDISLCLTRLRPIVAAGHSFYASFNEGTSAGNPGTSDSHGYFAYGVDELSTLAAAAGWDTDYLGDWGHPRGQKMMRFVAA